MNSYEKELNKIQDKAYAAHYKKLEKIALEIAQLELDDLNELFTEVAIMGNLKQLEDIKNSIEFVIEGYLDAHKESV